MLQMLLRPESPTSSPGNGMAILQNVPTHHISGGALDAQVPTQLIVQPTVVGNAGAPASAVPRQFTRAGLIAALAAINTYLSGLSASQLDQINTQLPGGLAVTVSPTQIVVPVPAGGASTLATSLAALLTAPNLTPIPAFN